MTDDLVKRQKEDALYAKDAWAKLAVEAGFRPYDTEASARSAFRHCADHIEALTAERDEYKRSATYSEDVVRAARAEIDRLKQEVDQFRRVNDGLQDAMLAAEAEQDRLRRELTKAADSLGWADAHLEDAGVISAQVRYGEKQARAAAERR